MKFSIPWESPKWWRLGCQTSNGAQGHLGKLIPSFTVQVTWPQLGGERFRAWERDLMFESMPGWMPLPWLPSCWRVEAGLNLYSRPLKGNQNGFFCWERPEKLKAPASYWGVVGGLRSVDTFWWFVRNSARKPPSEMYKKPDKKWDFNYLSLNWWTREPRISGCHQQ